MATVIYLATVIDLASRRPAGWAIADRMRTDLVSDVRAAAERTRGSLADPVTHTDHGAQYTGRGFAESFSATFERETLQGRRTWSSERGRRRTARVQGSGSRPRESPYGSLS
ncbi:DDE-type integrase/transposase/recombinase [Streptomyces sp. NPDC088387]|uniref:DDE-type integrase/transposase/recombinase n=1 Tax=Streptomyces sp. NPDC088387 TaxID=3365859 RepID=UPI00380DE6A4